MRGKEVLSGVLEICNHKFQVYIELRREIRNKFNFCIYDEEWVQYLYFVTKRTKSTHLIDLLLATWWRAEIA